MRTVTFTGWTWISAVTRFKFGLPKAALVQYELTAALFAIGHAGIIFQPPHQRDPDATSVTTASIWVAHKSPIDIDVNVSLS